MSSELESAAVDVPLDDGMSASATLSAEGYLEDEQGMLPPTYDESVLYDASGEAEGLPQGASGASAGDPGGAGDITVTVTDPTMQQSESSTFKSSFVMYTVNTKTSRPEFSQQSMSVKRRFKDFVALADRLRTNYKGYVVPPRPEKSMVEGQVMQSKDFIDDRRASLEKYLQRLVVHPVIGRSKELVAFLQLDGALGAMPEWTAAEPASAVTEEEGALPVDQASSAQRAPSLIGRFKHAMTSITSGPSPEDHDPDMEEKKDKVAELERLLTAASTTAESLLKRQEDLGDALGELGLSLIKLSKHEDTEAARLGQYSEVGSKIAEHAADVRRVGTASVRMSRLARAADDQTALQLSPLHDHLGMIPAARTALNDRVDARRHVALMKEDFETRSTRLKKLESGEARTLFGGRAQQVRELDFLTKDVPALKASVAASEAELESIKERNAAELERLKDERQIAFATMLRGLARVQAAYSDRSLSIWKSTSEAFGAEAQQT